MAIKIVEQHTNSLGIIIIKVDCNKGKIQDITRWCNENRCGKQVAIQRFAFKQEELTMFRLRWENT